MSDQILNQILEKLNQLDERMSRIEVDVKSIKTDTAEIPLIRRAVLETRDDIKELGYTQTKINSELNTHDYSIDILNRRQLKLEADLESLKSK